MSLQPRAAVAGGLLGSAALIAGVTAASRVAGFGRWLVFSGTVGSECVGNAYSTANQLPNVLFEVAAGGALAGVVVPLLAGSLVAGSRAEVAQISSALLTRAVAVLLPLSLLLAVLAVPLTDLMLGTPKCPAQRDVAVTMLLVFAPQVVLYGIGMVLTGVLQAHRRFFWPAVAPLLSSLMVIGAYLMFARLAHGTQADAASVPADALAWLTWGTTAGVAAMTLPLLVPVHRAGVRLRPAWALPAGLGRKAMALASAGVVALLAQQLNVVVVLLLANRGGVTGTLNVYQYTQAVYLLPYAVLAVPLATAAFPRLAERAAQGDRVGFASTCATTTRALLLASVLGVCLLGAAAPAVAAVFAGLDRGSVTGMSAALTAIAPGLVGFALIAHLGRALYALHAGRAAAVATSVGWLAAAAASVLVVNLAPAADATVVALALGSSIGMSVAGVGLLLALRRSAGPEALAGVARTAWVLGATGLVAVAAGRLVVSWLLGAWGSGSAAAVGSGTAAAATSAGVLVLGVVWLDRETATRLRRLAR